MFEIINLTEQEIKEQEDVQKVLEIGIQKEQLENICFNVIFVDNDYIHKLNREYRNIDRETDVITFALEDYEDIQMPIRLLGDIYISLDKAHTQAIDYGHSFQREICFLAVHGFYHLLGYDHQTEIEEKEMFAKQEAVLNDAGIKK